MTQHQRLAALAVILSVAVLPIAFQNCAPKTADFQPAGDESSLSDGGGGDVEVDPNIEEGEVVVDPGTQDKIYRGSVDTSRRSPSDILFVIDESVSMKDILAQVRAGFASLSTNTYPAQSRIAVTNMAPARLNAAGAILPTQAYVPNPTYTAELPGFLRLVNNASIVAFKTKYPANAGEFKSGACAQSWFTPADTDASGRPCLIGASQIVLTATGVEAGVVSLKQTVVRYHSAGVKLFRAGAAATIIFVSDTHDPGANYYGQNGAEKTMPSYSYLRNMIFNHQPALRGLKFNAIVPLPRAGNAALTGVNVIGVLPKTAEEERVSGEETHGYSYLPYVAASKGSAMHVVGNNWASAIKTMAEDIGYFVNPSVNIGVDVNVIKSVEVNGVKLNASEYSLSGRSLQLTRRSNWPAVLNIVVVFN